MMDKRSTAIAMEVLKLSIQEALITMFTDDPVNWLKWAIVFAILIGGYAIAVPLYKKVSHGVSWERKRDIAKSRNHVIKASLVDKHPSGEVSRYNWRAVYRYTVEGEERQYTAHFKHPATPPLTCISIISMILTSCFLARNTTMKTIRGCSCSQSSWAKQGGDRSC